MFKEYKVEVIRCAFATAKKFKETFQELIDKYAKEGWQLKQFDFAQGDICAVVFERESRY